MKNPLKLMRLRLLVIFVILSIPLAGKAQGQLIKIDGSSTVYPLSEAVVEEFSRANRNVRVTIGIAGTGGGFSRLIKNEIDIASASRQIHEAERLAAQKNGVNILELKVAYDAITIVVNPKNTWCNQLSVDQLKTIWEPQAQRSILSWNQVSSDWPDKPIKLYGPGVDSGTFDYFTQAIIGKEKESRGDYTASEDDNILVQGVSRDSDALGFFGLAYFQENSAALRAVPIVNPKSGLAVMPSHQSVVDGSYAPLSRPLFIYVNESALRRPEVQDLVRFYLSHADTLAEEVGYIGLSAKEKQDYLATLDTELAGLIKR